MAKMKSGWGKARQEALNRPFVPNLPKTEVHHIIPRREGGSDRQGNLIPLPHSTHVDIDQGATPKERKFYRDFIRKNTGGRFFGCKR